MLPIISNKVPAANDEMTARGAPPINQPGTKPQVTESARSESFMPIGELWENRKANRMQQTISHYGGFPLNPYELSDVSGENSEFLTENTPPNNQSSREVNERDEYHRKMNNLYEIDPQNYSNSTLATSFVSPRTYASSNWSRQAEALFPTNDHFRIETEGPICWNRGDSWNHQNYAYGDVATTQSYFTQWSSTNVFHEDRTGSAGSQYMKPSPSYTDLDLLPVGTSHMSNVTDVEDAGSSPYVQDSPMLGGSSAASNVSSNTEQFGKIPRQKRVMRARPSEKKELTEKERIKYERNREAYYRCADKKRFTKQQIEKFRNEMSEQLQLLQSENQSAEGNLFNKFSSRRSELQNDLNSAMGAVEQAVKGWKTQNEYLAPFLNEYLKNVKNPPPFNLDVSIFHLENKIQGLKGTLRTFVGRSGLSGSEESTKSRGNPSIQLLKLVIETTHLEFQVYKQEKISEFLKKIGHIWDSIAEQEPLMDASLEQRPFPKFVDFEKTF